MRGAVVMAAGAGRRMGLIPKSLLRRGGEPLLLRQLRLLRAAGVERIAVVLGYHAPALRAGLQQCGPGVSLAVNPAPDDGPGGSLRCGLAALGDDVDEILVLLGDQPLLELQDVQAVQAAWRTRPAGVELAVPWHDGQPGHPIAFGPALRTAILRAEGGLGVREWRRAHPQQVLAVPMDHARCTTDVDTPEDLLELQRSHGVRLEFEGLSPRVRPADPAGP